MTTRPMIGGAVIGCVIEAFAAACDEPLVTGPSGPVVSVHGRVIDLIAGTRLSAARSPTVSLLGRSVTATADGFYRIDVRCPPTGPLTTNTTFIRIGAGSCLVGHPARIGSQLI